MEPFEGTYDVLANIPLSVDGYVDLGVEEKHGNCERMWALHDDIKVHYLMATITPTQHPERPRLEVWLGVDDGNRIHRVLTYLTDSAKLDDSRVKEELAHAVAVTARWLTECLECERTGQLVRFSGNEMGQLFPKGEAHGGRVWAESKIGSATRYTSALR